jgi:hypothetical protein
MAEPVSSAETYEQNGSCGRKHSEDYSWIFRRIHAASALRVAHRGRREKKECRRNNEVQLAHFSPPAAESY